MTVFQSTQPEWAATLYEIVYINNINISIHAARVGCDANPYNALQFVIISIHAARVGCDLTVPVAFPTLR